MLTVGKLKELIANMPDDTLILQNDPFCEFSYIIADANICYTKFSHMTYDGEIFYESWDEDCFNDLINDNLEDEKEIRKEYKKAILLNLGG